MRGKTHPPRIPRTPQVIMGSFSNFDFDVNCFERIMDSLARDGGMIGLQRFQFFLVWKDQYSKLIWKMKTPKMNLVLFNHLLKEATQNSYVSNMQTMHPGESVLPHKLISKHAISALLVPWMQRSCDLACIRLRLLEHSATSIKCIGDVTKVVNSLRICQKG